MLLVAVGHFSRQFSGPIMPEVASWALLVTGIALVAAHFTSGFNRFVRRIRANFNDAEIRRLQELRTVNAAIAVQVTVGFTLPIISSAIGRLLGEVPHDTLVMFSIVLTAFGLGLGGLNGAAEFRLLKDSWVRTGGFANLDSRSSH